MVYGGGSKLNGQDKIEELEENNLELAEGVQMKRTAWGPKKGIKKLTSRRQIRRNHWQTKQCKNGGAHFERVFVCIKKAYEERMREIHRADRAMEKR